MDGLIQKSRRVDPTVSRKKKTPRELYRFLAKLQADGCTSFVSQQTKTSIGLVAFCLADESSGLALVPISGRDEKR